MKAGDLVAGIVRRLDPVPCTTASRRVGHVPQRPYTERGIKEIDGFMSERWRIEPNYAVKVDASLGLLGVLLEPTTVVTKAWEHLSAVGQRAYWRPRTVLVTGAGPIGLLAALLGRQQGLEVHVLDRAQSGPKPDLVRDLGATYHTGRVPDLPLEPDAIIDVLARRDCRRASARWRPAVSCVSPASAAAAARSLTRPQTWPPVVLQNNVVLGTVNANSAIGTRPARISRGPIGTGSGV